MAEMPSINDLGVSPLQNHEESRFVLTLFCIYNCILSVYVTTNVSSCSSTGSRCIVLWDVTGLVLDTNTVLMHILKRNIYPARNYKYHLI